MCSLAKDIGIDLGTASVLVYVKGKGVVLNEPSVVAINKDDGRLLSVGADAQAMLGRTPGNIVAIRPLREGVISDYDMTERMLKEFIRKVSGSFHHIFKPRVIICVPSGITEVEERAVVDAGLQSGASHVYLIEEPVAAAIGAGIDITKPEGHMVVDIGGGTSDIAVISLKGVVESASIKVAGDQFNEAIVKYMRRKHNILIGERTAEQMKMQIGCVFPKEDETTIEIKGRCLMTGLPFAAKLPRKFGWLALGCVVGCAACYVLGTIWFMVLTGLDLPTSLTYCVIPYLPGDVIKIALASLLTIQLDKRMPKI